MRIGDVLYFSPRYRFEDLNLDDAPTTVAALHDRLSGFYLAPASRLVEANDAFAAGLLCCAAIDFIALCAGDEPQAWLARNIEAFDDTLANQFWIRFRHGLMHEGRVKAFGEFSLDLPALATVAGPSLIINPRLLQQLTRGALTAYLERLDGADTERLLKRLRRYFQAEIDLARKVIETPPG